MEMIGTDFENWGQYLMKQFQLMFEKGERCDLEISCNKQIFLVHRLILSACSEYVKELNDKQHIILPEEVSCKALKAVIDFAYSGKIVFDKEEKDDLLLTANLLNMRLLTELIKMEESCSFTLSMDDESDDKNDEVLNNNSNIENQVKNVLNASDHNASGKLSNQVRCKRKSSEMKSSRTRTTNRNTFLPPLHKFPYLQQKFSGTRTYGLITNLTEPIPSRFEIPDSFLPFTTGYRSSFEDVSYETENMYPESEALSTLEETHKQFLKKLKSTYGTKRGYTNALYSPFDKYTPPCTINQEIISKKRDIVSSYLSKTENVTTRRYSGAQKVSDVAKTHLLLLNAKKSGGVSNPVETVVVVAAASATTSAAAANNISLLENTTIADKEDVTMEVITPVFDCVLPEEPSVGESQQPPPEIIEVPSIENGEKVELIKLNNVVVGLTEDDLRTRSSVPEEVPDISISLIESNQSVAAAAAADAVSDAMKAELLATLEGEDDEDDVQYLQTTCGTTSVIESETVVALLSNIITPADASSNPIETTVVDVDAESTSDTSMIVSPRQQNDSSSNVVAPFESDDVIANTNVSPCTTIDTPMDISYGDTASSEVPPDARETRLNAHEEPDKFVDNSAAAVVVVETGAATASPLTDENVSAPPLAPPEEASATNVTDISRTTTTTEPISQIFALKVKGTENPDQLSKLVDLCKRNPLFKNKNVRFKIVPVRGTIPKSLKEQARASGLNNTILVSKSQIADARLEKNRVEGATTNRKKTERKSPIASIENVAGPWECKLCESEERTTTTTSLTFKTYFEYRSHLHDVHKEPNNPIYCMHCGYKSLKRNVQLYHLFTKHNVGPPANLKFPKCDQCEFYAINEYYLQKHLSCHPTVGLEYVCSCKVAFKTSDSLQRHMVSGDCKNSKSFTCGYCRCMFDRFVNLKAHMRICMKERSKPSVQNNLLQLDRNVKTVPSDGDQNYSAFL